MKDETASIDLVSHDEFDLNAGIRFDKSFPVPVVYLLDEEIGGTLWPTLLLPQPVFHVSFLDALRRAGVDNIDDYPVKFIDANDNEFAIADQYRAVNIIGLVDCIDLDKSEFEEFEGMYIFDSITLDAGKIYGANAFRLAHEISYIVISSDIASRLNMASFPDVELQPLDS
jgi:hypothetical protein